MKKSLQKATVFSELDYFRNYSIIRQGCLIAWTRMILGRGGEEVARFWIYFEGNLLGLTDELECRM